MPKISVVIITFNEERNIERCLKSVIDVADEIVVVDSFSSDRTEEICRNYNIRFLQHKFEGYIDQKNWANSQAKYDYILSLDADEELSDELKKSIKNVKENWKFDSYYFNRLTYYCGKWIKHSSWYPARKLRLWDRRKGKWDGFNAHEVFVMQKNSTKKFLHGDLLHYSYYSIYEHILQINRYTDMLSGSYHKQGVTASYYTIIFHSCWRFLKDYFFKLGLLDGFYGLVVSINSAHETFLKYVKLKKIIDDELKLEPFRICFLTSSLNLSVGGQWQLNNIYSLTQNNIKAFLMANTKSTLITSAQKDKLWYITTPVNIFNPFRILKISFLLKRMRVSTVITDNRYDAWLAVICAKLSGIKDIVYHVHESNFGSNFSFNTLLFRKFINRFFINSTVKYDNNQIVKKNKVCILKQENNFEIDKNLFSRGLNITISLDKINKPNCGLGRVAIDFSRALISINDKHFNFTYLINGKSNYDHIKGQNIERLRFIYRIFPAFYGHNDILHYLHQTSSFKISGAKKTIITIHDLNFLFTKGPSKSRRYLKNTQKAVNNADAIVFISNFTKEICLKHLTISPDKITRVIYNGVDLPHASAIKPAFLDNDIYLFSIGQFLSKKNFHVLLPFLKNLPNDYKLVIAGEKNTFYGDYMKKMISENNLQNRVILPGPVTEAEKLYLYMNCKAFVFPSLAEGFGLPVIEAMRLGKPVFCSDKTSLKEIGDKYVFLWKSFDPIEMSEVFIKGMENFTEEKRQEAYEYSLKYSWEKNAKEYLELYKYLLESR